MNRISHVDKEFAESQVGDRIGWVRVTPTHNNPFIAIDVVTATVIDEDAQVGHRSWDTEHDNPDAPVSYFQKGLGKTAAFSALLSVDRNWQEEFNLEYTPEDLHSSLSPHYVPKAEDLLAYGTGGNRHHTNGAEKVWAKSPAELLDTLKQLLGEAHTENAYQTMYYWMNGAIGREYPDRSALYAVNPVELLLVDPTMSEQTREQLSHMLRIETALTQSLINDANMRNRLSGFVGDTPMEELPAKFIESRTRAAEAEKQISDEVANLVVKRLAYVPPGQGRAGRTWPYMDATEQDVDKAYGLELRDLRERKTDRAIHELDREVKELEARRILASESIQRFELLNEQERFH